MRKLHRVALAIAFISQLSNTLVGSAQPAVSKSIKSLMKSRHSNMFHFRDELEKLATNGDCVAQFLFGLLLQYYEEPGTRVIPWLRKAASCGVIAAEVPLASLIANTGDQVESAKLYLTAARHGDPVAYWFVANGYKNDYLHKGQINGPQALAWYLLAETRGDHKMVDNCRSNIAWLRHSISTNGIKEAEIIYNNLLKTIPVNSRYPEGFDENWLTMFNKGED